MRILVLLGGLTFFARCMDQAGPYWRVISGANKEAPPDSTNDPRDRPPLRH